MAMTARPIHSLRVAFGAMGALAAAAIVIVYSYVETGAKPRIVFEDA
jgi:hypothetical protein